MSTSDPKKPPPCIHKAPRQYGDDDSDEQDNPGPAKKKKGMAASAEKSTTATSEKLTKKKNHQSTSKIQKSKPKPTAPQAVASMQKRKASASLLEVEEVATPAILTQILEPKHMSVDTDDEFENGPPAGHEDDAIEIFEEPAESAETELSWYYILQLPSVDLINHRTVIKGLDLTNICIL